VIRRHRILIGCGLYVISSLRLVSAASTSDSVAPDVAHAPAQPFIIRDEITADPVKVVRKSVARQDTQAAKHAQIHAQTHPQTRQIPSGTVEPKQSVAPAHIVSPLAGHTLGLRVSLPVGEAASPPINAAAGDSATGAADAIDANTLWSGLLTLLSAPEGHINKTNIEQVLHIHLRSVPNADDKKTHTQRGVVAAGVDWDHDVISQATPKESTFIFGWGNKNGVPDPLSVTIPDAAHCIPDSQALLGLGQIGWVPVSPPMRPTKRVRSQQFSKGRTGSMTLYSGSKDHCLHFIYVTSGTATFIPGSSGAAPLTDSRASATPKADLKPADPKPKPASHAAVTLR